MTSLKQNEKNRLEKNKMHCYLIDAKRKLIAKKQHLKLFFKSPHGAQKGTSITYKQEQKESMLV